MKSSKYLRLSMLAFLLHNSRSSFSIPETNFWISSKPLDVRQQVQVHDDVTDSSSGKSNPDVVVDSPVVEKEKAAFLSGM